MRDGIAALVARLRQLANANEGDHTIGTVSYWSDDQLQTILDRNRRELRGLPINPAQRAPWESTYTVYTIPTYQRDLEYDGGLTDGWLLADSTGAPAPAHTVDLDAGLITFTTDTGGDTFYLMARAYDVNAAAADVWESKAGFLAAAVDWRSDNHQISASQEIDHCRRMAREYRARAGGGLIAVQMVRSDET